MPSCRQCGFELDQAAVRCPLCRAPVAGESRSGQFLPEEPEGPLLIPWEAEGGSFPGKLIASFTACVTSPRDFFSRLNHDGPFARPLLYYLVIVVVSSVFSLAWGTPALDEATVTSLGWAPPTDAPFQLLTFFVSPLAGLLLLGGATVVVHLLSLLLTTRPRPMSSTARTLCYASSPWVMSAVPWVGGLVGGIWSIVLLIVGISEVHSTTSGRAAAIVLLPYLLLILAMFALAALAAMWIGGLPELVFSQRPASGL